MNTGTSETKQNVDLEGELANVPEDKQNVDLVGHVANVFTPVMVSSEGTDPQNEVVMDDTLTQAALATSPRATDENAKEHELIITTDKDNSKDTEQESKPDGVEPIFETPNQEIAGDNIDNEKTASVEDIADKSAEGDVGISPDKHSHESGVSEERGIQESDLVKVVLEVFEARHVVETRPIPVLIKGKDVDLVQLSFQVRASGGYDRVTSWSSISKSLGFGQDCGPLLKLVYVKYLKSLENQRLLANQGAKQRAEGWPNVLKRENGGRRKKESSRNQSKKRAITSAKKIGPENEIATDNSALDNSVVTLSDGSESLSRVLSWMKRLALNPGDPKRGQGARVSRGSEAWAGKCETVAARLREVLWKKHEHSVFDFLPSEGQDEQPVRKRGGRGRLKGSSKKARHSGSYSISHKPRK